MALLFLGGYYVGSTYRTPPEMLEVIVATAIFTCVTLVFSDLVQDDQDSYLPIFTLPIVGALGILANLFIQTGLSNIGMLVVLLIIVSIAVAAGFIAGFIFSAILLFISQKVKG